MNSSNPVLISIISTLGGIVIAYITYVASQKVQTKRQNRQPKDRIERMFDGYERLIKAKDIEDERKTRIIESLSVSIEHLEDELGNTKTLLTNAREELQDSKTENEELRTSLAEIRTLYDSLKKQNTASV